MAWNETCMCGVEAQADMPIRPTRFGITKSTNHRDFHNNVIERAQKTPQPTSVSYWRMGDWAVRKDRSDMPTPEHKGDATNTEAGAEPVRRLPPSELSLAEQYAELQQLRLKVARSRGARDV